MNSSLESNNARGDQPESPHLSPDADPRGQSSLSGQLGGLGSQLGSQQFSMREAIGGPLGALEATLPTILVVAIYPLTNSLRLPVILALTVTVIFGAIRIFRHQSLRQVLAGLAGTLISVFWAWRSGQVENFFAFGFWINGVYSVILLATILARRPAIGWLVAGTVGKLDSWLRPPFRKFYELSRLCTWLWIGLFTLRLAVELPLYYANQLVPLGAARLILGLPAFALVGYFNWALLRAETSRLRGNDR
ncbi:MAG: DUF3159 domain-containing protein [Varibaculum cambriense]|uniref:DUF3159 domain-containing protein n=1 Tax=Varibaculum cambriense TaxID=184870 RepID=UPI002907C670|nr:DUF3159 domain-containing protein [Varibaculum cambriense]MDU4945344.1 DUF3159 domain-containing protein [Varibaculum cambriense]